MKNEAYLALAQNTVQHWWNLSKDKILAEFVNSLNIPKNGRILELGSGTGKFLSALRSMHKYGVDIKVYDNPHNSFTFIQADINQLPIKENSVDAVLLIDLLEHIPDDKSLLKRCLEALRERGKLLIFVPALKILWSDLDEIGMHIRRYTANDFNILLSKTNLKYRVLKSTYINFFLFPYIITVRLLQRLIKKVLKKFDSSAIRMPNRFINNILKFIFSSERFFLKFLNFPIGVSYLCVIEKG